MEPQEIAVLAVIGGVAGWLAAQITGRGSFGIIWNIVVGVAGAFVSGLLFSRVLTGVLPYGGILGQIMSATIGAVFLLLVISFLKRR